MRSRPARRAPARAQDIIDRAHALAANKVVRQPDAPRWKLSSARSTRASAEMLEATGRVPTLAAAPEARASRETCRPRRARTGLGARRACTRRPARTWCCRRRKKNPVATCSCARSTAARPRSISTAVLRLRGGRARAQGAARGQRRGLSRLPHAVGQLAHGRSPARHSPHRAARTLGTQGIRQRRRARRRGPRAAGRLHECHAAPWPRISTSRPGSSSRTARCWAASSRPPNNSNNESSPPRVPRSCAAAPGAGRSRQPATVAPAVAAPPASFPAQGAAQRSQPPADVAEEVVTDFDQDIASIFTDEAVELIDAAQGGAGAVEREPQQRRRPGGAQAPAAHPQGRCAHGGPDPDGRPVPRTRNPVHADRQRRRRRRRSRLLTGADARSTNWRACASPSARARVCRPRMA